LTGTTFVWIVDWILGGLRILAERRKGTAQNSLRRRRKRKLWARGGTYCLAGSDLSAVSACVGLRASRKERIGFGRASVRIIINIIDAKQYN
jgi:hypothetical protein